MFLQSLKHTEEIADDCTLSCVPVALNTVDTVHMFRSVDMWITGKVSYNYHDYLYPNYYIHWHCKMSFTLSAYDLLNLFIVIIEPVLSKRRIQLV